MVAMMCFLALIEEVSPLLEPQARCSYPSILLAGKERNQSQMALIET
jgi:hypothetical protein